MSNNLRLTSTIKAEPFLGGVTIINNPTYTGTIEVEEPLALRQSVGDTTSIPFTHNVSIVASHQMIGGRSITPNSVGALPGNRAFQSIIADGANIPTLSGFTKQSDSLSYVNVSGTTNVFEFWFDGTTYWYSIFQGDGTVTPIAPVSVSDDTANTQAFTHSLGTGELEVSIADGAYSAYAGPYAVGDVARPVGYWKCRVKAASGRNASAVTSSAAFTVASGGSSGTFVAHWGFKTSATPLTQSEIEASPLSGSFANGANIPADFTTNHTFQYLWMAEPSTEPIKIKTSTPLGDESIGSSDSTYSAAITVGPWRYYQTQAQTIADSEATTFKTT